MGVGAIFVSTLALSELQTPHDPPQGQEEFLAATLQIIVSFIVLCSIIIRRSNPLSLRLACRLTRYLMGHNRWFIDPVLLPQPPGPLPDGILDEDLDLRPGPMEPLTSGLGYLDQTPRVRTRLAICLSNR